MLEKVRKTIEKYQMIKEGETVLCCLSGGADSVALLLCLRSLGFSIRAMHINHCLRAGESDRDEQFCLELCKRLGVELTVKRVDVKGYCAETGASTEEGARQLRYDAFGQAPCDRIATAHTLSDSFETALFNIARGTAFKGLCGIPPVRGRIVRPLIECTRDEIERYLAEQGQTFVTDSTNLTDDYSRNRIRHNAVPALKTVNPDAEHAFARLAQSIARDDSYLTDLACELLERARTDHGYSLDVMRRAHPSLLTRAVVILLTEKKLPYSEARVTELCEIIMNGGRVCLSGDIFAYASTGVFRIAETTAPDLQEITVTGDCKFSLCGKNVSILITDRTQFEHKIHKMFTYIALDYDKIKGVIVVRTRRSGDRIRLHERGCTKTLKKLFGETVPAEMRDSVLVMCDSEGVLAAEGFGAAERAAVSDDTRRVLIFSVG